MRIIAVDPGYERMGIAVMEKEKRGGEKLIYSDCFKTDKKLEYFERFGLIGNEVERVILKYGPQVMCLETIFFSVNQKTAISVAEARGVILFQASKHNLKVYEYGPGTVKAAVTGYGRSAKAAMPAMIERLVKIDKEITHDDEYDAIAVGLTCFATEKFSP